MTRINSTDWDLIRGDDFGIRLAFTDAAGEPLDVSGWSFTGQVRTDPDAADPALADFTFDDSAAEDGTIEAELAAADTTNFETRYVVYDIQAVNDDGRKQTYMWGRLNVIKDVTRP